jgi:hypothetical protein
LADEPRTLENLRFSSFALSATPDPDLPAGATNASPESIHLGVGPDPWGNRPPVSDDFAERYPRLAGVAVLTEEPLGVDTWWEFEQEAWLRSTNSAVSGHAVAHEFRVEPDSFQSLGEVGTEVVLSTQEGGRILVTTRIFGADDELLGALVIDTDDPDSFSQWPYHPLQPLHFEPATSLRISTTIQAWGDAAFGWIVYGFGAAGPPFTYRLVEGTVEITGFVDGIGAEVTVPSEIGGLPVTRIGDRAFLGADEIVSITLPSTVTSIGRYAIAGCHGLTRVDLPDQLTRIEEGAFADCPSLTAILVDPGNAEFHSQDGVLLSQATKTVVRCPEGKIGAFEIPQGFSTVGPGAFAGCRSLTEIMIPDSITVIGESAFRACVALREVDLPSGLTQVADGLFVDCQELQRVSLPDSVTAIGNYAFVHCAELADISIPKNVVSIGENAFYGCMALTRIVVPPGVTDIPSGAFQGCSGLYAVVLSEGLASIGARTFASCISLTSVIIPESVSWILEGAFYGCTNLERVYFAGNAPSLGNGVFGSTPASLYYLPGSSGWSSPFGGRPAVLWNPRILTNDGTLGMHAGQFGFIIMGAADVPVAVEACWDLANPDWTTITHLTCGADGTVQFTDHEVASHPTRIYRFRPE